MTEAADSYQEARSRDQQNRRTIRGAQTLSIPISLDNAIRLDANIVVRAGAGSGKTTVLIDRMIALVRSGVPAERIAAITFTKKASGELLERFLSRLHEVEAELCVLVETGSSSEKEQWSVELARIRAAAQMDEGTFIGTIHSFCGRILRARAFDAGIPPDFVQLEDTEEEQYRRAFWLKYLDQTNEAGDDDLHLLQAEDIPENDLFAFFGTICKNADLNICAKPAKQPELADVVRRSFQMIELLAPATQTVSQKDPFVEAVDKAQRYAGVFSMDDPFEQAAYLRILAGMADSKGLLRIKVTYWSRDRRSAEYAFAKELRDGGDQVADGRSLSSFLTQDVSGALKQWDAWLYGRALAFSQRAVQAYREMRLLEGKLTWDDLLREAAELMGRSSHARAWAQATWSRLLVDEFQDTDPVQARMLFYLCSLQPDLVHWERSPLLTGRLFIVGDDKQSIYRFRRADFQVFDVCAKAIQDQGGLLAPLMANFRSDERLCEWVNRSVGPLFEDPAPPFQAPWADLLPDRGELDDEPVIYRLNLLPDGNKVSTLVRAEAIRIADMIRTLNGTTVREDDGRERPLRYGDFMILLRRGKYMSLYVSELAKRGIPVSIGAGNAAEAGDTLAVISDLLKSLLDPGDGVALAATLRGSLFGISDADLWSFCKAGGYISDALASADMLPAAPARILHARRTLVEAKEEFLTRRPYEALLRIISRNGWMAHMVVGPSGDIDAGIMTRILALFRSWQARNWNWRECATALESYRQGEIDMDVHSLSSALPDRVQIMTIHQAKGLQADIVFLADPRASAVQAPLLHTWRDESGHHAVIPIVQSTGFGRRVTLAPLEWEETVTSAQLFELAEARRLMYVAVTRAKRRLIVSKANSGAAGPWSDLAPALEGCPSWDVAPVSTTIEAAGEEVYLDEDLVDTVRKSVAGNRETIETLKIPTILVERPSDHEIFGGTMVAGGLGREYGSLVHRLFEALVAHGKTPPNETMIRAVAERILPGSFSEPGIRAAIGFVQSPVFELLASSDRVLTEVPFTTAQENNGIQTVVNGTVDLAILAGNSWTLIDYKTDNLDAEYLLERYVGQVRAYVQSWKRVFPGSEVNGCIWSSQLDQLIMVEPPAPTNPPIS